MTASRMGRRYCPDCNKCFDANPNTERCPECREKYEQDIKQHKPRDPMYGLYRVYMDGIPAHLDVYNIYESIQMGVISPADPVYKGETRGRVVMRNGEPEWRRYGR